MIGDAALVKMGLRDPLIEWEPVLPPVPGGTSRQASMHTIRFDGKQPGSADCEQEISLLAASAKAGVPLNHRCGGHARCGTCVVTIAEGAEHLTEMGAAETRVLKALKAQPDQRLACQAWARGEVLCKY